MSSVGSISLNLGINTRQFNKQVNGIQKQTTKAFSFISVAVGNIMADMATKAVASIGNFVKDSIDKGSEIAELQNVVDSVFTSMADKVDTFAKGSLDAYGLTEKQAKQMVGTYGAMSKAFGYTEQQAYDMSTALTGLTGDVASFYNLDHDVAYTKLKSVFTGETESLKELGVVMTQSALDQFALANGFGKTTNDMNEQEKVALRLAFVQDKLAVASGDFTKTQSQWANQTRILSGQFETFKSVIGQGFINVLTPLLNTINTLMGKLIQLANTFKAFTDMISGGGGGGSAGSAMIEVAEAASSAASSTGGIEDAANGAAKAAKKAQKALMGFDEINKLSKNDSSGSSGASAGAISVPVTPMMPEISSGEGSFLDSILGNINFEPIKTAFAGLKEAVMPVIDTIGQGVQWFMDNILSPLGTWVIEDAVPAFFNLLSGALEVLDPLLNSLKPSLTWIWENFLQPIASWTGGVIVDTLNWMGDALDKVGNWMSDNQSTVDAITTSVVAFFAAWKVVELMSFIQQAGGVISIMKTLTSTIWKNIAAKVADKAETVALTLLYAKDFVVSIAQGTAALVKQAAQWVATTAMKVADTAATVASTIATGAMTAATWLLNTAMAVLTSPITLIIAAIAALIAIIVLLVKNWDTVKEVTTKVFKAIWDVIKKVINSILGGIESFINGVLSGINFMIRALNKLKFKVPDWVPSLGGKELGFNLKEVSKVSVPRLAEGGYVRANQPQLAMIGDNKTQGEIVSPEGKMFEIMMKALESFFGRLMDMGYGGQGNNQDAGDIVIPIYLDGTLLDEVIVTAQQRRALRSGGV